MAKFKIDIPVRMQRVPEFGVDFEPVVERTIKFGLEADDEDEAIELVRMLFFNEIEAEEMETDEKGLLS